MKKALFSLLGLLAVIGSLIAVPTLAAARPQGTVTVFGGTAPSSAARHADPSVELGMRFTATADGEIRGIRVYRPSGSSAAQPATLWSPSGAALATTTIPATSAAGWRYAGLPRPVDVTAGTIYTVSYHSADGYVATGGYFSGGRSFTGAVRPAAGKNGVYAYGPSPIRPTLTYNATNYWVDVAFDAAGGPTPTTTPPAPTTTLPTTPPPTTTLPTTPRPTTTAPTTTPPPGGPVQPGTVGFLGNPASLTVISGPDTAPPGTTWVANGTLRVDTDNLRLDHVYVKGTIDYYGHGTLSIHDSIVESIGVGWAVILLRTTDAYFEISDSTVTWPADVAPPGSPWSNGCIHGDAASFVLRNDISGCPDGVQQAGGDSIYDSNYIHDPRLIGVYPNNSHNDGLQLYGGPDYVVRNNYIELEGYDGTHQNAAVFFSDDGARTPSPVVVNNYMSGGGFQLRFEATTSDAYVTDNIFGPLDGGFGHASASGGATIETWTRNVDNNGDTVPRP